MRLATVFNPEKAKSKLYCWDAIMRTPLKTGCELKRANLLAEGGTATPAKLFQLPRR
jgi:hypothetical protein